jgi:rod shape-determining protein MreC
VWTVTAMSPFERALVSTGRFFRTRFHNYVDLHDARQQNRELQDEVARLKLEQARLRQDAEQAKRLQVLLGFTQHYAGQLVPAQVIGTSGTEQSHLIQIDKGSRNAGIKVDMPVITPDGIVGKVKDVFPYTSQVLMINDRDSGAGVILETSRLQGILRGSLSGELHVGDIMADEKINEGEEVVTSGGDRIYPKGLPVGTINHVSADRDNDSFLAISVKPAADLNRLEEVLVVTKAAEEGPQSASSPANVRAADILSERLPSVPKPDETKKGAKAGAAASASPSPSSPPGSSGQLQTPSAEVKKGAGAAANPVVTTKSPSKPAANSSPSPAPSPVMAAPAKTPAAGVAEPRTATAAPAKAPEPGASPVRNSRELAPKKAPSSVTGQKTTGTDPAGVNTKKAGSVLSTAAADATPKPAAKKPKPQASPTPAATPSDTVNPDGGQTKPTTDAEKPPR